MLENVKSMAELQKEYKRLAFIHHPDKGGDLETMKALNNEYERLFEDFKAGRVPTGNKDKSTYTGLAEDYIRVINQLIRLDGIEIELTGTWLWIGGNTKQYKDELKKAGCYWAAKKALWYWRPATEASGKRTRPMDMHKIREKYGSTKLEAEEQKKISAQKTTEGGENSPQ